MAKKDFFLPETEPLVVMRYVSGVRRWGLGQYIGNTCGAAFVRGGILIVVICNVIRKALANASSLSRRGAAPAPKANPVVWRNSHRQDQT